MVTYLTFLIQLMIHILSATAVNRPPSVKELNLAIHEMQTANYFSFVMLIQMYPPNRIPGNVTFLMPNDRMLSQIPLPEDTIYKFLLRHSIPSPLLFDHLEHFPTGSMIPTSQQNFMLKVSNNGRRSFYLNDVQIISPNICTAGSSIRCHGIKGLLIEPERNNSQPSPTCSPPSSKDAAGPASPKGAREPAIPKTPPGPASAKSADAPASPPLPVPLPFPSPPSPPSSLDQMPTAAPPIDNPDNGSRKSGSSRLVYKGTLLTVAPYVILSLGALQLW